VEQCSARRLEELSLNSWPALQTICLDGWVLRFANGYTNRSNSISPLYASNMTIDEKIRECEQIYAMKRLPVVFKISPAATPQDLDALLQAKGYEAGRLTSVQVLDLGNLLFPESSRGLETKVSESINDEWLSGFSAMNTVSQTNQVTLRQIVGNIVTPKCLISLLKEGTTVAYGLGVLEGEYVGLYDIVTHPEHRNQGIGTDLVVSLLKWAKGHGAKRAYLHVMMNNHPALKVYGRLGFRERYQYWYRVKHVAAL
jgi:ribosomal protein S18 acetylase RimI-like enzyme